MIRRSAGPGGPVASLPGAIWCGREDSNLHALRRQPLKLVRLPIPPRPHVMGAEPGPGSSHGPGPGARTSSKTGRREQAAATPDRRRLARRHPCRLDCAGIPRDRHESTPPPSRRMGRLAGACPLRDGARGHGSAHRRDRCRTPAGARLAARAPSSLHGRHQRGAPPSSSMPRAFLCTARDAAAATPITGPASASATSCSMSAHASATCAPTSRRSRGSSWTRWHELGVASRTIEGRVGVWVAREPAASAEEYEKVAAIGVRLRRWVSSHGFSINVAPDLEHFAGIVPCGIADAGVTSLARLGVDARMDIVDASPARGLRAALRADLGCPAREPSGCRGPTPRRRQVKST